MINTYEYEQLIEKYLSRSEGLIRLYLRNKDAYHIDEIKSRFRLKALGYKNKKKGKGYEIVQGEIPVNIQKAIMHQDEESTFLNTVLINLIKNYNKNKLEPEEEKENKALLKEIRKLNHLEELFEINELDELNEDFIEYVSSLVQDPRIKDKRLGLLLIYLIEVLEVKPKAVYSLLGITKKNKRDYVNRTKKQIKQMIRREFPEIDFNTIEKRIEKKKDIIIFIKKNQEEVKIKLKPINKKIAKLNKMAEQEAVKEQIRELEALKRKLKADNLKQAMEELDKLFDDLGLEKGRASNLKRYIRENFYNESAIRAIENVHVWLKDFEKVALFIKFYRR